MVDGRSMLELILRRQSDRSYSNRPVENEKVERIIEAGRMAPSACNAQPWKFIVVTDPELRARISVAAKAGITGINSFVKQAPVLLIVIREKANMSSRIGSTIKSKDYSLIDIGIACENICLQASAEELGSCMVGWFDEKEVKKILGIPSSRRVELIITIGYPERDSRMKRRKPLSDVVSYNKY
jgi:nitroreductase